MVDECHVAAVHADRTLLIQAVIARTGRPVPAASEAR